MEQLYQPYLRLTAGQRKLLCFLAYTDKRTERRILSVYAKVEDLTAEQTRKIIKSVANGLSLIHI